MGALLLACLLVSCVDDRASLNSDPDELAVALVGQWVLESEGDSDLLLALKVESLEWSLVGFLLAEPPGYRGIA